MIESKISAGSSEDESTIIPVTFGDRRRPGRIEVTRSLLPLLRNRHDQFALLTDAPSDVQLDDEPMTNPLLPARGIAAGLLLSVPIWAALLATIHALLRLTLHS